MTLAIINIIGFVYGIYYYSEQLLMWHPIYWILIIDCPFQALLAGILLIGSTIEPIRKNRIFGFFTNFVSVGLIKYGLWTMCVILIYYEFFLFSDFFLYSILFLAHLGLFLEGIVFSRMNEMKKMHLLPILLFYLLNDFSDYVIGTHPIIPEIWIEWIAVGTFLLTLISTYVVGKKSWKIEQLDWIERMLMD